MLTLNHLIETRPDLRLRWAHPAQAGVYGDTRVSEVTAVVPTRQTGQDIRSQHLPVSGGGLALVTWRHPPGESASGQLCDLIADLRLHNAAGLVLRTPEPSIAANPQVRGQAEKSKLPVLTTGADSEWVGVNHFIQQQRAAAAERHAERLENLLLRMPAHAESSSAATDILTWLASALDAEVVLGSRERGVRNAVPGDRTNLARRLIGSPEAGGRVPAEHTRVVRVMGGDTLVLGVASRRPFDGADVGLIRHAAKYLGLYEQVRREHQAKVVGPRRVSLAATQLLLCAESPKAQLVAHTLAPCLGEARHVSVRIIDSGDRDREPTLRWCEDNLGARALVSPSPDNPRQTVVVTSARHDEAVGADLLALVRERDWLVMGASRPHGVEASGRAYAEAAQALRSASRLPSRVSSGVQPKLASLLPQAPAHAWAANLLAPVLRNPTHQQLLDTLRIGCSFKPAEASRGLGIHRNTLRQRLTRAGRLLGLDLDTVNDRILVLLALDVLAAPAPSSVPPGPVPDLDELLRQEAETVRSWAESRLSPLCASPRDLVNTLCVWLEHDQSVRRTAQALSLSEATVRHHTYDATALLGMDVEKSTTSLPDTSRVNLADVGVAAYVLLGRPQLRLSGTPLTSRSLHRV